MNKILTFAVTGVAVVGMTAVAEAQSVFADTFSSVTGVASNGYETFTSGNTLTGDAVWSVYGVSVDAVGPNFKSPAAPGQWIDLAGTPGPGGINMELGSLSGGNYTLTFDAMNNSGDSMLASLSTNSDVTSGGTSVAVTNNGNWSLYTVNFSGVASGTNYLDFYSSNANDGNIGVTNITLTPQAVPEPITTALVSGGASFGFFMLKRKVAH